MHDGAYEIDADAWLGIRCDDTVLRVRIYIYIYMYVYVWLPAKAMLGKNVSKPTKAN